MDPETSIDGAQTQDLRPHRLHAFSPQLCALRGRDHLLFATWDHRGGREGRILVPLENTCSTLASLDRH
jgi:hypothetical protein